MPTFLIPDEEFEWTFVRAGGPGGQNVNKVASKAVLHWNVRESQSLPATIKERLLQQQHNRITREGKLVLSSQKFRDQNRNVADCLEKIQALIEQASALPKKRKPTRPTRSSKKARVAGKRFRSQTKASRKKPSEE